ncbi:MAG: hypothetical protein LBS19_04310 [Clostridiales bacterium]|jgi:hypothetical protein|nr:hypothetical protein [Clostridiales bacterium]
MRKCKLRTGSAPVIEITREAFESATEKKPPYYSGDPKSDGRQFAVCPACENPIKIIGMYKKLTLTDKPYGKHFPHTVKGLASYSQQEYEYCILRGSAKISKSSRRPESSGMPREILKLLRSQFDLVADILSKETDIRFSRSLLRHMLRTYLGEQGHRYFGATLYNLPWVFGYMSNSQKLYGQYIRKDSPLAHMIQLRCPEIILTGSDSGDYAQVSKSGVSFVDLNFCFIHHRQKATGYDLSESITFHVSRGLGTPPETVYEKTIEIDPAFFPNLIHTPREIAGRKEALLALAGEEITGI